MSDLISGIGDSLSGIGDAIGDAASDVFSFFSETSKTTLGYLYLDVLTTETLTLPSDVTKYPVEDGNGDISDHITMNNEELEIDGLVSAATSFGMEFGSKCYSKMIDAIDQLRTMHEERQPITVVTGLGQYEEFAFTGLTVTRTSGDKGGQWLSIKANLRKIKKVALKKTDLPADTKTDGTGSASGKTGSTENRTGKSGESSTPPSDGGRESIAHTMKAKGGNIVDQAKTGLSHFFGGGS
jgi:hypothetical protein